MPKIQAETVELIAGLLLIAPFVGAVAVVFAAYVGR